MGIGRALTWPLRKLAALFRTKSSRGERFWSTLMKGFGWWGTPGAWSQDRVLQVQKYRHWVYVAVRAIAEEISGLPAHVATVRSPDEVEARKSNPAFLRRLLSPRLRKRAMARLQSHEDLELVDGDHPLYRLLQNPNPPDTRETFWQRLVMYLELTGNTYVWAVPGKVKGAGGLPLPSELWALPSHWVWPGRERNGAEARDSTELVQWYEIRPAGLTAATGYRIPADEVIHIAYPHPLTLWDGFAPLSAMAEWVDIQDAMDLSQYGSFKQGIWPGMVFGLDKDMNDPEPEAIEQLYARLEERFRGEINTDRPMILGPGMTVLERSRPPKDMDYLQGGDAIRDKVLAGYRVSKVIAGITEEVNRASMETASANFARWTIRPKLRLIDGFLTEKLAGRYDPRLCVYHEDPVADDRQQKLAEYTAGLEKGCVSPDEYRQEVLGLEPLEQGGDKPLIAGGLVPVTDAGKPPPAQVPPPGQAAGKTLRKGDWNEGDHPRADDGKFGSGGGSEDGSEGGKWQSPQERYDAWKERDDARDAAQERLTDLGNDADAAPPTDADLTARMDDAHQSGDHDGAAAAGHDTADAYKAQWSGLREKLTAEGATDEDLAGLDAVTARATEAVTKAAEAHAEAAGKAKEAAEALAEHRANPVPEPDLPEEPDEPEDLEPPEEPEEPSRFFDSEPQRSDYDGLHDTPEEDQANYEGDRGEWEKEEEAQRQYEEAHAAWEKESARVEKENEKQRQQYERDHGKWEKDVAKAEERHEKDTERYDDRETKLDEKADAAAERWSDKRDALDETIGKQHEKVAAAAVKLTDKLSARIDAERDADPVPDDDEEDQGAKAAPHPRRRTPPRSLTEDDMPLNLTVNVTPPPVTLSPTIEVRTPQPPAPVVHVAPPSVTVEAAHVHMPAPVVTMGPPPVVNVENKVESPSVHVAPVVEASLKTSLTRETPPAPEVQRIEIVRMPRRKKTTERDRSGDIESVTEEDA